MRTNSKKLKIFFEIAVCLFLFFVNTAIGQEDEDFNDAYLLDIDANNNSYHKFSNAKDAVCRIISEDRKVGTGVLLNNSNNDGKMYVLTAAHLLPGYDNDATTQDIATMNSHLANYKFDFTYQRFVTDFTGVPLYEKNPNRVKGAKIVALYHKNIDYSSGLDYYLQPTDLVLLELLGKPNSNTFKPFYAGWNFNDGLSYDEHILIHHPRGFPKKISMPIEETEANLWSYKIPETGRYISQYSNILTDQEWLPEDEPPYSMIMIEISNDDETGEYYAWKDMFSDDIWGVPTRGSSGAPYFNSSNQVYSINKGRYLEDSKYHSEEQLFTISEKLTEDKFFVNPNYNPNSSNNPLEYYPLAFYLRDFEDNELELDGCYPCAAGVNGLPLREERRYLKTLEISEEILGNITQDFVAQDEIQISSLIRPGARISFAAEQVLLGGGTNFERGSEVEITSGGKNGMSCATGCYSINIPTNPEHFLSNGSCFLKEIKNAENFTVQITLNDGTIYNFPEQPIHGSTVKLFELLDLKQNASAIKNTTATVKATFTNDCDTPKEVTFQITFDNALEDNAFLSDYYHYKEDPAHSSKMPSIETYMANKKALAQWYQPATSFQPTTAQYPEDVVFEIGVEKDITYAKASGYEWNFRGGKGYRTINPAITSGNGESFLHNTQIIGGHQFVENGRLKMDIYYPKLKQGITASQAPALPVICYVFGGGYVTHDQPELGDEICRWFAQKGYIVAFIDYRIGADLTNKEISKRAPIRAWQDVNAAVQFLRMQGQKTTGVSDKWKIDPNKIYGNGWSAGAIASLHNLTLNQTQYQAERNDGNFLEYTKAGKAYTSLNIPYTTYDLNAYPTIPCKPGETDCTGSNVDAQFNAVGVFAGAIGKADWLNNLQRPAIDIHHHDDEIVLWGEGAPFKNVAPKTNFVGLTQVPPLYGGGYLKENFPNNTQFDVVTLTEEWQAGGEPTDWLSAGKLHASMIKWGDRAGVNHPARLENKEMFLLDGFFMNQGSQNASRTKSIEETQIKIDNPSAIFNLYPNPSNGKFKLDFFLKAQGLVHFKIINLNGQTLFEQKDKVFKKGNNLFSFDLGNKLTSGLYFLKVDSKEFSGTLKIIIE